MNIKDNRVYNAAIKFCSMFKKITPEVLIGGYAKLLLMDEVNLEVILPSDCSDEIESARKWFSANELDLELIKSGLYLLVASIPSSVVEAKYAGFFDYIEKEEKKTKSADILSKALEMAIIPVKELFKSGNNLDSVWEYADVLKEEYGEKGTETETETEKPDKKETKENGKKSADEKKQDSEKKSVIKKKSLSELSMKYKNLSDALLSVVKGQNPAVHKFIQGYNRGELLKQTEKGNHPRTYFFFFGPPGVGKTFLAETAAEYLGIPNRKFNMSEYASQQSHEDLIGVSTIYKGAKEGTLVRFVRENPECLLIFDEIEKAHLNVIRQFLQILGSGEIYNVYREEVTSFRDATIIFTSNVGRELYSDRSINLPSLPEKVLIDAIEKEKNSMGLPALPPEICSRIASGNTVVFNHLSVQHLVEIIRGNFDEIVEGMKREYDVNVTYAKELPLLFLYKIGGELDARVAVGQSGLFLKNEIFELLRQLENEEGKTKIKNIRIDIEWKGMDKELKSLFKNNEKAEVLVFSDNEKMFSDLGDDYKIHRVATLAEADQLIKNDISVVYIDPFYGKSEDDETVLSISDYNTDGVKLFHNLTEKNSGLPIYLLEMDGSFSETDKRTFLQEGAFGTVSIRSDQASSFKRKFIQTMDELYMEKESVNFSQRGWVIDFGTKQEKTDKDGKVRILFYGLKKKMAVDIESRGSILSDAERPNIRFKDVIGAEKAKDDLRYFVNYLLNPRKFLMNGGKTPKGVLLYGPPGTGKTMLAKAMAGESDVTFLQTSATEFMNKYAGESEANIRRIFAKAKKYAPSIIFIDEIDAIGKQRTGSDNTAHTEGMLNALLTEMDGFSSGDSTKPVFVLAATNYGAGEEGDGVARLDEALIRRFDNKIYVDLPNESERKEYILLMKEKKKMTSVTEAAAQSIAERTTGQSLAILQNVIDLAFRNANKENRTVTDSDLLTALEEYLHGEKKERSPEYYKEVAIHEMGHAYVSYILGDKPSYITIESRGNFGGYMQHSNSEEVTGYTKEDLLGKIRTSLAGRAAEQVFFGKEKSLNTGASSDLHHATELAWRIICSYGMTDDSLIVLDKEDIFKSALAAEYVSKVNKLLEEEMKKTVSIIEGAKDKIQKLADVLVKENRLTGAQFEELMSN